MVWKFASGLRRTLMSYIALLTLLTATHASFLAGQESTNVSRNGETLQKPVYPLTGLKVYGAAPGNTLVVGADGTVSGANMAPGIAGTVFGAQGTSSNPTTGASYAHPFNLLTVNDRSEQTSNSAAQGDGNYVPVFGVIAHEFGSASLAPFYSEYYLHPGANGAAIGSSNNVSTIPGSNPRVVAHNPTITDASHWFITGCTRISNVATCKTNPSDPPLSFSAPGNGGTDGIFLTGVSDSSFNNFGAVLPTRIDAHTFSYPSVGANVVKPTSGGWVSTFHLFFGMELNINNGNHDPGPPEAAYLENRSPVWGYVCQPTPYAYKNPTGAPNIPNQPISSCFFAGGGSQHDAFTAYDASNILFRAGVPQANHVSNAQEGFHASELAPAAVGTNYPSEKSCWAKSTADAAGQPHVSEVCMQYVPTSNSPNSPGIFRVSTSKASFYFTDAGEIVGVNGSAGAPGFGFAGDPTTGIFRAPDGSVHLSVSGADKGALGKGYSGTKTAGSCVFTIVNGIITNVSGC